MRLIHTTLCFIFDEQNRCLMLRRQRPPHRGQWNAPGGKLREGETPHAACLREVKEEAGLTLDQVEALGSVDCVDVVDTDNAWRLHLFVAIHPHVPVPVGPEGELAWLELGTLLEGRETMVHNIPLILPLLLRGIALRGTFEYRGDYLLAYSISLTEEGRGMKI